LYIQPPTFDTTVAIQITVKARCRKAARGSALCVDGARGSGPDFLALVTLAGGSTELQSIAAGQGMRPDPDYRYT
jgi:hypothetical protein